jgi:predicted O-methyltransferase YrrM
VFGGNMAVLSPHQILEQRNPGVGGLSRPQATALATLVERERPRISLETEFAHGISTVFICAALPTGARHIVIDPYQHEWYDGAGLANVKDSGFADRIDFREQPSHVALAELEAEGVTLDFAFIDSSHEFDRTIIELFYIDRLLTPGGLLVLDDNQLRNVRQVARYAIAAYGYAAETRAADTGRLRLAGRRLRRLVRGLRTLPAAVRFAFSGEQAELLYLEIPWPREHGLAVLRKPLSSEHADWRVDNPI